MQQKDSSEQLYKQALSSSYIPDEALNRELKRKLEERLPVRQTQKFVIRPILALALVVCMSITAFAAWYFLSPSDVAGLLDHPALAEAFSGKEAIIVNETQSQNGFDITFLGIVSGRGLLELDPDIDASRTYAVVAIAKAEGQMPDVSDEDYDSVPFFVSPLIHGQQPWRYNIASMGGAYQSCVAGGVMYRLIECDDIEIFAGYGLSLIVSSTNFYSTEAYSYDEATGLVTPYTGFDGVNLLFDLPIDPDKGDAEAAGRYLETVWADDAPDIAGDSDAQGADEEPAGSHYTTDVDAQGNLIITAD